MTTTKTVALEDLTGPEGPKVEKYNRVGMGPTQRCDRCGAQAYLEVKFNDPGQPTEGINEDVQVRRSPLMFCAHHANESEASIFTMTGVTIHDHRPFLAYQESQPLAL